MSNASSKCLHCSRFTACDMALSAWLLLVSGVPEMSSVCYVGEWPLTGIATLAPDEGATDLAAA